MIGRQVLAGIVLAGAGLGQTTPLDGAALFQSYCASCHAKDGKGNGPMTKALKNTPPDLTKIATRNRGMFPSQRIEKIISGEEELNTHGPRLMPVWGPIFSQVEWDRDLGRVRIANLAKFLQSIQVASK